MNGETFIAYWSGGEPTGTGHSPTLDQTPDYVNVVPLYYVKVDPQGNLLFNEMTQYNSQQTIMGWMQDIRTRQAGQDVKTKFTLCFLGGEGMLVPKTADFVASVTAAVSAWGADGVTIDYEPQQFDSAIVDLVTAIRDALPAGAVMTAPIWVPWLDYPEMLQGFAAPFDYIETMDYTPYVGLQETESHYARYAQAIGTASDPAYGKVAIGISCMNPLGGKATTFSDVPALCQFEPSGASKLGVMLFTLSYDAAGHPGNKYPNWAYTDAIHANLP